MKKILMLLIGCLFLSTSCVSQGYVYSTYSEPNTLYYRSYPVDYYNGVYYYLCNHKWYVIEPCYHHLIQNVKLRPHNHRYHTHRPKYDYRYHHKHHNVTKPYDPKHPNNHVHPPKKPNVSRPPMSRPNNQHRPSSRPTNNRRSYSSRTNR